MLCRLHLQVPANDGVRVADQPGVGRFLKAAASRRVARGNLMYLFSRVGETLPLQGRPRELFGGYSKNARSVALAVSHYSQAGHSTAPVYPTSDKTSAYVKTCRLLIFTGGRRKCRSYTSARSNSLRKGLA